VQKPFFDEHPEELKHIARKCLEIGLRRIVGGVHYPCDIRGAVIFNHYATQKWGVDKINELYEKYTEIAFTEGIDKIWK
jgi:hypothetical protein